MARLFISHSSANNAAAIALSRWLGEQGFDDVFLDVDPARGLVAGDKWQEALKAAADRCEAVLYLVSPAWLTSNWCLAEFLLAKTLHKRIFGLIVEPVALNRIPAEMTTEWQLCDLTAEGERRTFEIDLGTKRETVALSEAALSMLRRGLERAGLDAQSFPWPPAGERNRAPYRGLRALEAQDVAIFFGRDAAIVRALDRLRGLVEGGVEKLLIVLGASGSGKSSFLRAGLWPRIARDDLLFLPLQAIRPEIAVITGGSGLVAALVAAFDRFGAPRTPGRIKEALAEGGSGFVQLLNEIAELGKRRLVHIDQAASGPTIVFSIDQAEELFNADGTSEAEQFLDLLGAVLTPSSGAAVPRVFVLACIRSDRYELLQAEQRFANLKRDLIDLPPLPPSEFKSVIEGPARRVVEANGRLSIEPALTEKLIADAQGADALPLLSFTLERLYADYGGGGTLTLADYRKLGGVQGSIEAAVAQALVEPGRAPAIPAAKEEQLARMRAAFIPWLARVAPETGVPLRRLARLDEIPEASRTIVERLVAARLLVADQRGGVSVLEVAHEALLRQWPALASWLEADASDLKVIDGVERAASEWGRNNRHLAWLDHRAERLVAAECLTTRDDFRKRLGKEGSDYLAACRAREETERRDKEEALAREQARLVEIASAQTHTARMQWIARWALGATAVVVIAGLGVGVWQQTRLASQRVVLEHGRTNLYAELSTVERLRENWDAALRFSVHGARLGRALNEPATAASLGRVELAAALSQSGWRLSLGGHEDWMTSAAFSPNGNRIVTASLDKTARLWDATSGREIGVVRGHEGGLRSAMFSPDGLRIVTSSDDQTARIWDASSERAISVLRGHKAAVMGAAFSPDGERIVTASFDKTARIWNAANAEEITVLRGHDDWVFAAAFSPDGTRIVTASQDKTARLWDAATGKEIVILRGHEAPVYFAAFSPDGTRVVTASGDSTARIWDVSTGQEIGLLRGHDDYLDSATFSPDGTRIVTASADKTARIWDAATGQEMAVLRGHVNYLNSAAFSPNGSQIVTASKDKTVRIWDTVRQKEIAILRGHQNYVNSAAFISDGSRIVTASADATARVWDAATGMEIAVLCGHEAPVRAATFSPDGSRIVTASQDKTARIWDAATGKQVAVLRGHDNWVLSAAFSLDGLRIVTASWDNTVRIWDAGTAAEIAVLRGHEGPVWSAAFSRDGSRIVTASWDKTARIWDAATGKAIATLRGHEVPVWSAAFSPDGQRVVTASEDNTARIWDAATGKEIEVMRGHENTVYFAAFSPDGTRIVTASGDKTARIWDAATGNEIAVLRGHENWVLSATYSFDGARVVTASRDNTARIWDARFPAISTEDLIAEACGRRIGRLSNLTRDEMRLAGYPNDAPEIDVCAGIE